MNAIIVMICYVIANESAQMVVLQGDHMIEELAAATSYPALSRPILPGACTLVRFGCRPLHFKNAITSASNFES